MSQKHLILSDATLQAILDLQDQLIILGVPEVEVAKEGDSSVVTLKVQMSPTAFQINRYIDLVYQTLEDTSTKACTIRVEIAPYEPLDWEET